MHSWAAITVTDASGQNLSLPQPAQKIISLSSHLTENIYALGAQHLLVGRIGFNDYPPEAETLPTVGDFTQLDLEKIIQLQPDLILAWHSGSPKKQLEKLQQLGFKVYFSEPQTFAGLINELNQLGQLTGTQTAAQLISHNLTKQINSLAQQYSHLRPVSIFYQVESRPLMTLNKDHLINEAIELCGGVNVFAQLPALVPMLNHEALIKANPEIIFAGVPPEKTNTWQQEWYKFKYLQAVEKKQLFSLPASIISRPTPRFIQATQQMCTLIDQVRNLEPTQI